VFAFSVPAAMTFSNRIDTPMVIRALATAGLQRIFTNVFPLPVVGFEPARGVFGGAETEFQASPGGLFETVRFRATGSGNSVDAGADLRGSRSRDTGLFRDRDWGLNYRYADQPAEASGVALPVAASTTGFAVRESAVSARYGSSTKALANGSALLRFGGSISGGNSQSTAPLATPTLESTGLGGLKLYAGAMLQGGRYSGRLSYGVQRSQYGQDFSSGLFKHLIDTRHELRFLPSNHRPLSVEIDLGAGSLPSGRPVPAGEKFFGGNTVRSFIPGDSWDIRADPYLRSLPQFSLRPGGSAFGASRFFAWNTTVAQTAWGRPLIAKEVMDAGVGTALQGQLVSAERVLSNDYVIKDTGFAQLRAAVIAFGTAAADFRKELVELRSRLAPAEQAQVDSALSDFDDIDSAVETVQEVPDKDQSPTVPYRTLAKGFNEANPATLSIAAANIRNIKDGVAPADLARLEKMASQLDQVRKEFSAQLDAIETRADASAKKEMAYAVRLVNRLLNEINTVAVAPALIFDVVKVGPEMVNPRGWRIGLGPAARLSLVNVNVTLGYAFNMGQRPFEPRGAFFFRFDVSDLFR
jgi:hypothetical protein